MKDAMIARYRHTKMVDAVNRCMDALCASGLSADGAEYLPSCLDQAIRASNQVAAQNTQFRATHVNVKEIDGGYDVTPFELRSVR